MTPERGLPRGLLLALGLIAASLLLYGKNFASPPIWDDHYFVLEQPFLSDPANLREVLDPRNLIRVLPVTNSARPVWLASVLADRALLGPSFTALKVSNALWHGLGAALLALLAWELTASAAAALVAGALFVTHPLHGEVVGIVTFRADSVAFVFMMLALILHLRARRARAALPLRAVSLAAFALALLAKESATALPFLLPLVEWAAPPDRDGRTFSRPRVYAAFALLLLGYAYFRVPRSGYVTRDGADVFSQMRISHPEVFAPVSQPRPETAPAPRRAVAEPHDPPPWSRAMSVPATRVRTMIVVHGASLWRLVLPYSLQGDYAPKMALSWLDPRLAASLLAWGLLLAAAVRLRRSRPLLAAALVWIPAAMVPVSGLVMMTNLTADRYLYTASAGVCLAVASLFSEGAPVGARARRGRFFFALELAAVWAVLSASHLRSFRNDWLFFAATAHADPDVPRARLNLAVVQSNYGRMQEAERNFKEAVRLWPDSRRVARAYADFLESQGRPEEARRLRESAAALPDAQRRSTTIAPPIPPPAQAANIP